VGQCETFVDGNSVGYTITGIKDDTGGTTRGVERQDGLDSDVKGRSIESLEHNLGHLLTVSLGVQGSFREEDRMFLGCDAEFVVEGMMPDLLHVIPVSDNAVLDGIFQGEDSTL